MTDNPSSGTVCKHCRKQIINDKSIGWVTACFGDILCFAEMSVNPRQGGHEPAEPISSLPQTHEPQKGLRKISDGIYTTDMRNSRRIDDQRIQDILNRAGSARPEMPAELKWTSLCEHVDFDTARSAIYCICCRSIKFMSSPTTPGTQPSEPEDTPKVEELLTKAAKRLTNLVIVNRDKLPPQLDVIFKQELRGILQTIRPLFPSGSTASKVLKAAKELLDAMETCHVCKGALILQEHPVHCEDCSGDCENHEGPECTTIQTLHSNLRRALKAAPSGSTALQSSPGTGEAQDAKSDFVNKEQHMKPSIGRIVIYNHPGSSDGKYPPQKSPAIIQNVAEDGSVRLFVFGPKGQHMDEGLTQGDGPCQWNWPERV